MATYKHDRGVELGSTEKQLQLSGQWSLAVCRSNSKDACVSELQVQSATAPECLDCVLDEYKPVYFNALIHHLKTVTVGSLSHPQSESHIRPLWLSQESSSQIFQIDCEVDTGASCNILPLYKAKALFGDDLKFGKPIVNLKSYHDSPVENLGSYIGSYVTMLTRNVDESEE